MLSSRTFLEVRPQIQQAFKHLSKHEGGLVVEPVNMDLETVQQKQRKRFEARTAARGNEHAPAAAPMLPRSKHHETLVCIHRRTRQRRCTQDDPGVILSWSTLQLQQEQQHQLQRDAGNPQQIRLKHGKKRTSKPISVALRSY